MPFNCEEIKAGDRLVCVKHESSCFHLGREYEVLDVIIDTHPLRVRVQMRCDCPDVAPEYWDVGPESMRHNWFNHISREVPW